MCEPLRTFDARQMNAQYDIRDVAAAQQQPLLSTDKSGIHPGLGARYPFTCEHENGAKMHLLAEAFVGFSRGENHFLEAG
jgi:hypothetical protein